MSKNLNSELKKEENYTCDPSKRGVKGSSGALGCGPYGERPTYYTNYINNLLSNQIGQIEHTSLRKIKSQRNVHCFPVVLFSIAL
jgi:hypothetical protein